MATRAQVVAKVPTVGLGFDSVKFSEAITPEVTIDEEIDFNVNELSVQKIFINNEELGDYSSFESAFTRNL